MQTNQINSLLSMAVRALVGPGKTQASSFDFEGLMRLTLQKARKIRLLQLANIISQQNPSQPAAKSRTSFQATEALPAIPMISSASQAMASPGTYSPQNLEIAPKPSASKPTPDSSKTSPYQRQTRQEFDDMIVKASRKHGVDVNLVRAVVTAESDFDPNTLSRAGAMGLMQLMPETARDLGVSDPYDPAQNIDGGTRYLASMLKRFNGDLDKALAAYNWGPSNVERGGSLPSETRNYLKKVTRFKTLYAQGFRTQA